MFKKIVVPLDGSPLAESIFPYLEEISSSTEKPTIFVLRVIPPLPYVVEERIGIEALQIELEKEAKVYLEKIAESLKSKGFNTETAIRFGRVGDTIGDYAEEIGGDLIAISAHGYSGIQRFLLGSVTERVLRTSVTPLLVVRPKEK